MIKINPLLEKKIFGLTVNEILAISSGAFCGEAFNSCFKIENGWLNFVIYILAWIVGIILWTVIISFIKTFITKED